MARVEIRICDYCSKSVRSDDPKDHDHPFWSWMTFKCHDGEVVDFCSAWCWADYATRLAKRLQPKEGE